MRGWMFAFSFFFANLFLNLAYSGNLLYKQGNSSYLRYKGINGNELYDLSQDQLNLRISDFLDLGVKWVRLDFDWSVVQPHSRESYDWSSYDRVIRALSLNEIKVLGLLAYTPKWASGDKKSKYFPPTDAGAFAHFSGQAARRYGADIVPAWEIWNEPNLAQFWRPSADPIAYSKLLILASSAIKRASPQALVLSGGLAQPYKSEHDWDARDFLAVIYDNGVRRYIDAVANHPYTSPHLPSSILGANWRKMTIGIPSMREIMVRNGDMGKKIWITEFGAPTGGIDEYGVAVNEEHQAKMVDDVFRLAKDEDWTGPVFWYNYKDFCPISSGKSSECYYGLVTSDGNKKTSYFHYRNVR